MEDPRGDPSQEDFVDTDSLSLQPTTRLPAGLGDSSQFTTQGAPHGAQNHNGQRNRGLKPRTGSSLDASSQPPLLSRTESTSTSGHRGVNTDGGDPVDPLGTSDGNSRPQPSAVSAELLGRKCKEVHDSTS